MNSTLANETLKPFINPVQAGDLTNQVLGWLKIAIAKIDSVFMFLASWIAPKINLTETLVFMLILALISLIIASKITERRGLAYFGLTAVLFSIFYAFKT